MAKIKDNQPKPRNDAYTGLLAISFLALVGATVLMAMDASELGTPPPAFKTEGPGAKIGPSSNSLNRPDTTKVDTSPNPEPKAPEPKAPEPMPMAPMPMAPMPGMPMAPMPGMPMMPPAPPAPVPAPPMMSRGAPEIDLPPVVVPPTIIRAGATEPATIVVPAPAKPAPAIEPAKLPIGDEPPLNIKPFVPPMS